MGEETNRSSNANTVKSLHKSLRKQMKQGVQCDTIWVNLLANEQLLSSYAHSMHSLAKQQWDEGSNTCRIRWCVHACRSYFRDGGMLKMIRKRHKKQKFEEIRNLGVEETDVVRANIDESVGALKVDDFWKCSLDEGRLLLLDVGSCFNPFKQFSEDFMAVPVDISPATDDVIRCDFLNLQFGSSSSGLHQERLKDQYDTMQHISKYQGSCRDLHFEKTIREHFSNEVPIVSCFDVVVFSLLLSYFPSPSQRLQCCINAHKMLKMWGVLIIVTPDSSHQNRRAAMMRSWNSALEKVGFSRSKYEKLTHLHCMVFCKCVNTTYDLDDVSEAMFIPQDFQKCEPDNRQSTTRQETSEYELELFSNIDIF